MLLKATSKDREVLSKQRSKVWSGALTQKQFQDRNQRLYGHSFGKRVTTYLYKQGGEIVSSMDILSVKILCLSGVEDGYLVASVLTPAEHRKKGFASQMLSAFMKIEEEKPGILFSDIAPAFYQRYGFWLRRVGVVENAAIKSTEEPRSCSLKELVNEMNQFRSQKMESAEHPAAAIHMDEEFLDWQLDRFRFFHEVNHKPVPKDYSWVIEHGKEKHFLCAAPNPAKNQLEILWMHPSCAQCLESGARLAGSLGYPKVVHWDYWSNSPRTKYESPMARVKGANQTFFVDPQLCDWW